MINAVSSTPTNNNNDQPLSPVGVPIVPVAPVTTTTTTSVVEHPITPVTPVAAPLPSAGPAPTATAPMSAFPSRPDLREDKTSFNPTPSVQTTTTTTTGGNALPPKKKNPGLILGIVAFLILIIGGGVGLYLSSNNQDTRQQAATGVYNQTCGSTCTTNVDCPASHSCSVNKCVLTACLSNGASCDANKCNITTPTTAPTTAPTAPPTAAACSVGFVAVANNSVSCQKLSYQDELSNGAGTYALTTQKTTFAPGDVIVFKLTATNNGQAAAPISLSDLLADNGTNNLGKVTFMDSDCGANAYNSANNTVTCGASTVAVGASVTHIFRVRLNTTIADGTNIVNTGTAAIDANTSSTCSVTVNISNPVTYTCNSGCTTDAQCQTANGNYVCSNNVCRLNTNTSSSTCTPPTTTTYACNSDCTTDAQCQSVNGSYVCDANNGNKCRLDSDRNSASCTPPVNTYVCNGSCSTDAQCQTANGNYVCSNSLCRLNSNPTATNCQPSTPVPPAVGCNETCVTNSDCSASNHICVTTNSGLRCRLDNYVNSETCTTPGVTVVQPSPTPASTPVIAEQPEKPATLPKTGSTETTIRFLIMGAGAVVLGALGLLLL